MLYQSAPGLAGNLPYALSREWLETDGTGSYASSTLCGLNTRRYHGLFVAALDPPVRRNVLLSKLEPTVVAGGRAWELGSNQYPGVVHPDGYTRLADFHIDPLPTWVWRVETFAVEQTLFLVHGARLLAVQFRLLEGDGAALELRPLLAYRDYHALTQQNPVLNAELHETSGGVSIAPYASLPPLHFAHNCDSLTQTGEWYRQFQYAREQERGLDFEEDLLQPFVLHHALQPGRPATLLVSLEARDVADYDALRAAELERRRRFAGDRLAYAASQFPVRRAASMSLIAGYHWFTDWGRDSMVALRGLTLETGDIATAREILLTFAGYLSEGMLPNCFPDAGEAPRYNTVDATLWFVEAIRAFAGASGEYDLVRAGLYPALCDIVDWHVRGTRYGIGVEPNGLLRCGAPGVQLTWMDAKVGDWVVTPRAGMPVEIQALWYNALSIVAELAGRFDDTERASQCGALLTKIRECFLQLFWNEERQCLFDVVDGDSRDGSLRPNQIFAVSLPHPLVKGPRAEQILATVERELLTPYGLRTLARGDAGYRGRYEGDARSRDSAYHQGTVWPWLMGAFVDAYLRVHRGGEAECRVFLAPLMESLDDAGVGQISEIYDGDAPHAPRGCIAQAWSVGEVLRAARRAEAG